MEDVFIISAARTPVGKFQGSLSGFTATQLGSLAIQEAVRRAEIQPHTVEECIMGNVLPAGLGQNPSRQAALGAKLAVETAAVTINKVCGSGLKAVALAAQAVATGDASIVVAGGMESMSNVPYLLPKARQGLRMGDAIVVDSIIRDGLSDAYSGVHMGETAEKVAEKYLIGRAEQDAYALASHQKAAQASDEGAFTKELISVEFAVKQGSSAVSVLNHDEGIRKNTSVEALAALRPAFKADGTVTAGNAPSINDAAAALVIASATEVRNSQLRPLARICAQATSGMEPQWVLMAPVSAIQKLMLRTGWALKDVDLVELNEAFSVQAIAVIRELGLDPSKVNVNGGAVAIGHPIGASGARILVTLVHAMLRRNARRGIAALCLGGGNAIALAIEIC